MRSQSMRGGLRPLRAFEPWVSRRGDIEVVHRQPRRRVPAPPVETAEPPEDETRPAPALDPRRVHVVLTAILEVHGRSRPVEQLRSVVSEPLYRQIALKVGAVRQLRLRTVRTCRPTDRTLEVCGRVHTGQRDLALVARFEAGDNDWRCTSFDLIGDGPTSGAPSRTFGGKVT
jgi:hypothetical protein